MFNMIFKSAAYLDFWGVITSTGSMITVQGIPFESSIKLRYEAPSDLQVEYVKRK